MKTYFGDYYLTSNSALVAISMQQIKVKEVSLCQGSNQEAKLKHLLSQKYSFLLLFLEVELSICKFSTKKGKKTRNSNKKQPFLL
jgi:hypothetical protein